MKLIVSVSGLLIFAVVCIVVLQIAASERVEVVELHTMDASGEEQTTRLWIVDHEGRPYLRGDDGSGWVKRLKASAQVSLTRDGERHPYRWQVRPEKIETINQLMRDKYTWGDQVITTVIGDRGESNMFALKKIEG